MSEQRAAVARSEPFSLEVFFSLSLRYEPGYKVSCVRSPHYTLPSQTNFSTKQQTKQPRKFRHPASIPAHTDKLTMRRICSSSYRCVVRPRAAASTVLLSTLCGMSTPFRTQYSCNTQYSLASSTPSITVASRVYHSSSRTTFSSASDTSVQPPLPQLQNDKRGQRVWKAKHQQPDNIITTSDEEYWDKSVDDVHDRRIVDDSLARICEQVSDVCFRC